MARRSPFTEGTVAAIIVARGMTPVLRKLLDSLASQSRLPDRLIVCDVRAPRTSALSSGQVIVAEDLPESSLLISVGRARNLSDALSRLAKDSRGGQVLHEHDWLWILHDDCDPSSTCLEEQLKAAQAGASIAAVTPKVFRPDGTLAEVGVRATASGRRVPDILDGEIDQGQYDGTSDVLAGGSAGLLVSSEAYMRVGGFDRALGPYNEGLELCWRLHRSGFRVVAAPDAHLTHLQLSSPRKHRTASAMRSRRSSEFYFASLISSPAALVAQALASIVWIPLTCFGLLLSGKPKSAYARFFAWLGLLTHVPHILASRARHNRCATQPRSSLRPLVTSRWDAMRSRRVRRSAHTDEEATSWRDSLLEKRHSDRAVRLVTCVGLLLLTLWIFRSDFSGLSGGAWRTLPDRFNDLWTYAWSGWLPAGDGSAHALDPVVMIWSLICAPFALIGIAPATLLQIFLILAPAWAAWNIDVLTSRFSHQSTLRVALMCLWAGAPSQLFAMTSGRMSSLIVHVFVPLWIASLYALGEREDSLLRRAWARTALIGLVVVSAYPLLLFLALIALLRFPKRASTLIPSCVLILPYLVDIISSRAWPAFFVPAEAAASFQRAPFGLAAWGLPAASSLAWTVCSMLVLGCVWGFAIWSAVRTGGHSSAEGSVPLVPYVAGILVAGLGALFVSHLAVDADTSALYGWGGALSSIQLLMLVLVTLNSDRRDVCTDSLAGGVFRLAACAGIVPLLVLSVSAWLPLIPSEQWSARSAQSQVPLVSRYAQNSSRDARIAVMTVGAESEIDLRIWREAGASWTEHSSVASWTKLSSRIEASNDPASADLLTTIATLVSFPDDTTAQHLGLHAIDTIIVRSSGPVPSSMTRTLDRAPGIEKIGETEAGSAWRVRPNGTKPARLCLSEASVNSPCTELASGVVGARVRLPRAGVIRLAERANPHWVAYVDGQRLEAGEPSNQWGQSFVAPSAGELTLSYRSPFIQGWKILSGISALVIIGALLRGRKDEYDNAD